MPFASFHSRRPPAVHAALTPVRYSAHRWRFGERRLSGKCEFRRHSRHLVGLSWHSTGNSIDVLAVHGPKRRRDQVPRSDAAWIWAHANSASAVRTPRVTVRLFEAKKSDLHTQNSTEWCIDLNQLIYRLHGNRYIATADDASILTQEPIVAQHVEAVLGMLTKKIAAAKRLPTSHIAHGLPLGCDEADACYMYSTFTGAQTLGAMMLLSTLSS